MGTTEEGLPGRGDADPPTTPALDPRLPHPPGSYGPYPHGPYPHGPYPHGPYPHGPYPHGPYPDGSAAGPPMAFAPPGHRQGAYGYPPLAEPPWVSHRYSGAALAAGGAGVSVLAFLFLPYQVVIVALTAPQVIRMNAATDPAWNLVWAVPAVTVALGLLALTELGGHRRRPSSRVRTFTFLRALSAALIGVHLIDIAVLSARDDVGDLSSSVVDLLGVGFWLGFFGVVTAYIGSVIELRNLRRWRRQIGVAAGWW